MKKATLFLIPSPIAADTSEKHIPEVVKETCRNLKFFLAENIRESRRYLSEIGMPLPISELHFGTLNKDTQVSELAGLLKPMENGEDMGVLSDAGCPGIADPGSMAAAFAHKKGYQVIALPGPSSIFMALMGSGFSGQGFCFHGYLPIDKQKQAQAIKRMEAEVGKSGQSQIFMETPYRNMNLLDELLKSCNQDTLLCIASNLSAPNQILETRSIRNWTQNQPDLHKKPTIFVLGRH